MSIIIVKSVTYIYDYMVNNNYSLAADLVLFLGLILILIIILSHSKYIFKKNNF